MLSGLPLLARASLSLLLALGGPAAAWAADERSPARALKDERLYQQGLSRYSRGDRRGALAAFRKALRRRPDDRFAQAAVRRVEAELARGDAPASVPGARSEHTRFERLVLVDAPRWFYFERTLGDGWSALGTQTALNARVSQLLIERRVCRASSRRCGGDRPLRELVRRSALAGRSPGEV